MGHYDVRAMYGQATAALDADSNGGTDIELVAAKTGYHIVVDEFVVSMSAAGNFFVESDDASSDTLKWPTTYLAANTSFGKDGDNLFRTDVSEALVFTISLTGSVSVWVRYHYEPGA